jgi:hypothetical protein
MSLRSLIRATIRRLWVDQRHARYHFIHIPKNAGESVREALFLRREVSLSNPYHYRYIDIADEVGRQLKFFAIVRNPWSRTASRYNFGRQNSRHWPLDDPRRIYIERATFTDYVRDRKVLPIPAHPGKPWMGPLSSWLDQLEWLRDEKGRVACDCLRMERLPEDLSAYFGRSIQLYRKNQTRISYDYRSMYTDELAEIVANTFKADIDYFGFNFDGPATRNVFRED